MLLIFKKDEVSRGWFRKLLSYEHLLRSSTPTHYYLASLERYKRQDIPAGSSTYQYLFSYHTWWPPFPRQFPTARAGRGAWSTDHVTDQIHKQSSSQPNLEPHSYIHSHDMNNTTCPSLEHGRSKSFRFSGQLKIGQPT